MIGKGKFGLVMLAYSHELQDNVAVKILDKSLMEEEDRQMVMNEVYILKLCKHPNIVKLLEVKENAEKIFISLFLISHGVRRGR